MKVYAKKYVTRLWAMFLLAGLSMVTITSLSSAATPKIGDSYNGGIVFYVDGTGQHGLVAAKADMTGSSGKTEGFFNWYDAKVAANTFVDGYCDWFLPNKEQLNQLYIHRGSLGVTLNTYYWSSSESGAGKAWAQDFSNGQQLDGNKTNTSRVRAIRLF
jgi:hypothetical protein